MTTLADICFETEVEIIDTRLQHKRGPGQTCAHGTLIEILRAGGPEHLRSVLITIMQSDNNKMALVRPVILAVSDLLRAHPKWFGSEWLATFDSINLADLYRGAKAHREVAATRHVLIGMLLERLLPKFRDQPELFQKDGA